jgi:hypothetical protein
MKRGYQIQIEAGLDPALDLQAREMADNFINGCKGQWGLGGRGSHAFYRRGIFGLHNKNKTLVFRRISKHRRVFGVLQPKHLRNLDGSEINMNICMCASHLGGTRVKMDDFNRYIYYSTGEIKG